MQDLQESALFQELKGSAPFFLMAGPNVIQSEAHCLKMCRQIKVRSLPTDRLHYNRLDG
jgi:3-deoxy-D-manno-octulosonic acid (KDO) 8-phosphate synthase